MLIPVMLQVAGRRCVVVGGGPVGLRRARRLSGAGASVVVVSPQVVEDLHALPGVELRLEVFRPAHLLGAALVVAATDRAEVNQAVGAAAAAAGVWCNRADAGSEGDLTFMAAVDLPPVTVAVDSGVGSPRVAQAVRDRVREALPADWIARTVAALRRTPGDA